MGRSGSRLLAARTRQSGPGAKGRESTLTGSRHKQQVRARSDGQRIVRPSAKHARQSAAMPTRIVRSLKLSSDIGDHRRCHRWRALMPGFVSCLPLPCQPKGSMKLL